MTDDILKPYLGDERSTWFTLDDADLAMSDDLRAVGIHSGTIDGQITSFELPSEQDALDAAASQTMRMIQGLDADLNRYTMAEDAETALTHARYRAFMEPLERTRGQLAAVVERIAEQSAFEGKAKSRKTPYGTFGVRKLPERFEIIDPNSLLAWARLHAPEIITKPEPKERILQKDAEGAVRALYDTDEPERIIPLTGCRIVPEVPAAPFFKLTATP